MSLRAVRVYVMNDLPGNALSVPDVTNAPPGWELHGFSGRFSTAFTPALAAGQGVYR